MATTKRRLNITLSPELEAAVMVLAERDNVPQARKISELLEEALEVEEDVVWDKLARARDVKGARFVPHERAWR